MSDSIAAEHEAPPSTEVALADTQAPVAHVTQAVALMTDDEIRRAWRLAGALAESGVYKDVKQAGEAFAKIIVGRDLGLTPGQALQSIDFVEGALQVRAVTLAAWVRKSGRYDYRIVEHTPETCSIAFYTVTPAGKEPLGVSTFTIEDAKSAQLVKDHAKSSWKAHPRNMLFARAMSNGVKWHAPDLTGGIPVYTEGDSFVDGTAEDLGAGAGAGDGQAQGLDLGPKVEEVIARAGELGHAGISDRATVEMTLGQQPPGKVDEWVRWAMHELDVMEQAAAPADAEVVPEGEGEGAVEAVDAPEAPAEAEAFAQQVRTERAEALRAEADALEEEGRRAADEGDDERADELRGQVQGLRDEAGAMDDPGQGTLDVG